jgi:hypothetical protein
MRFLGLVAFTVMVAYAIAVTPVLKWAFVAHQLQQHEDNLRLPSEDAQRHP